MPDLTRVTATLMLTARSRRGTEHDAVRHFAGGDQPLQRDEQLARQRK
jgi:hypothetical protein